MDNTNKSFADEPQGATRLVNLPANKQSSREKATKISPHFKTVIFAGLSVTAWYPSFYPDSIIHATATSTEQMHVCQYCFKYTVIPEEMIQHEEHCILRATIPGKLVYQKQPFSIREVDGNEDKLFCQCLSLFAKLFLDNKSIYYDVEGFQFYLLCHNTDWSSTNEPRSTIVGFFSKEKMSWDDYNLACILVFPPYQQKGLGSLLIAFSYELSRLSGKIGSPEKPLSVLGKQVYISYWTYAIAKVLLSVPPLEPVTITQLSKRTSIHTEDIMSAFRNLLTANAVRLQADKVTVSRKGLNEWLSRGGRTVVDLVDVHRVTTEPKMQAQEGHSLNRLVH